MVTIERLACYAESGDFSALDKIVQAGSPIQVDGFLYPNGLGSWVLSSESGLKTCCIGKGSKIATQIVLEGEFSGAATDRVVRVQGRLVVQPKYDEQNNLIRLYSLKNAILEKQSRVPYLGILFGFSSIGLAGILFRRIRS